MDVRWFQRLNGCRQPESFGNPVIPTVVAALSLVVLHVHPTLSPPPKNLDPTPVINLPASVLVLPLAFSDLLATNLLPHRYEGTCAHLTLGH